MCAHAHVKKLGKDKKKLIKVFTYIYVGIDDNGADARDTFHCVSLYTYFIFQLCNC